MRPIDIDNLLPEDLDLTTLVRDASFVPPAPDTHDGSKATAQAARDSPSRNNPPRQGQSIATAEADLARLTRDNSTAQPALQPPNGGAAMAQTARTIPHPNGPPLQGRNFVTSEAIGEAEATTPESITAWITEMLATYRDL